MIRDQAEKSAPIRAENPLEVSWGNGAADPCAPIAGREDVSGAKDAVPLRRTADDRHAARDGDPVFHLLVIIRAKAPHRSWHGAYRGEMACVVPDALRLSGP